MMIDKTTLSKQIGDCHAISTHLLEHIGDKDIAKIASYEINEIIRELEKMNNLIEQYNNN